MHNPSYTGPRGDVVSIVPPTARRVLDIGCSNGRLGSFLKERQACQVTGIELDAAMAADAEGVLDHVVVTDLNDLVSLEKLPGEPFDAIIAADVLEHLVDPWTTVRLLSAKLSQGGYLIVSLPNVAHISTFWALISKKWPYRDRGIHDRTHLRFFSLGNIKELLPENLLEILLLKRNFRIIERPHKLNKRAKYFNIYPISDFFTFQYIVVARKK